MKYALGLSIVLPFAFASAVEAQPPSVAPETAHTPILNGDETSYWKPSSVDAIVSLHRCPGTLACGEIIWYNANDKRVAGNFGDPKAPRGQQQDFCGFSPRMSFQEVSINKWKGTMEMRGRSMTVRMDVDAIDANTIRLTGYLNPMTRGLFSRKDVWRRVDPKDPRYPACKK